MRGCAGARVRELAAPESSAEPMMGKASKRKQNRPVFVCFSFGRIR
jgi:hypothetical protein